MPNIFTELPRMRFDGPNVSKDKRLFALLRLAIRNMTNVHTLRIVYGHMNIASALVAGLLDPRRISYIPLRKLWLESCCISIRTWRLITEASADLEAIRIRRLEMNDLHGSEVGPHDFSLCRGGHSFQMHNGTGGWTGTTMYASQEGLPEPWKPYTLEVLDHQATIFDRAIWEALPTIQDFAAAHPCDEPDLPVEYSITLPLILLCQKSMNTLTSLNLDWMMWRRTEHDTDDVPRRLLQNLANLRFPHLRALQIRNAVLLHTKLPEHMYLLQDCWLEFMEAHPKIQCLAWPADRFFNHNRSSIDVQTRTRKVIAQLANTLKDLRVDFQYAGHGETLTDISNTTDEAFEAVRRRRFVAEFAPHMRKLEQIKLEGGLPRDEKREILRALHWCPLKKIVMIGASFPAGNTWGAQGSQLRALDPGQSPDTVYNLEQEEYDNFPYRHAPDNFEFEAEYGWPPQPPLLQTIAEHHAETVEELKLCGYNGCPILYYDRVVSEPVLHSLRHFHNLKQLVVSFWLITWFETAYRDTEIIQSWLDRRSSTSTALAVVTPPASSPSQELPVDPGQFPLADVTRMPPRQDFNRWAVMLRTRFAPSALAYRVAHDIGPHISPAAKNRPGGIRVRGSFCLGAREEGRAASDIFDLDIRIGRDNQVLEFIGPREEGEKGRWWQKLEGRQWF